MLTRRDYTRTVLTGSGVLLAGCLGDIDTPTAGDVESGVESLSGGTETSDGPPDMTQSLSAGFDRLEWHADGAALLYLHPDHDMNSFLIAHEYNDRIEDSIEGCEAPDFAGPIEIELLDILTQHRSEYPTRRFVLMAVRGQGMADCTREERVSAPFVTEELARAYFTVPEAFGI